MEQNKIKKVGGNGTEGTVKIMRPHKAEYLLATEFVDALRYFDPKGDECLLCGVCTNRHKCDYEDLRSCKQGISEWIVKVTKLVGVQLIPPQP